MKILSKDFLRTIFRKGISGPLSIDEVLNRLEAIHTTLSGIAVTPETCTQAPTVQAINQAVSRRLSTLSLDVIQRKTRKGRPIKEPLPKHPIAALLRKPNHWQTNVAYWMDAASYMVRYNRYYANKRVGITGPVRALFPLHPLDVELRQADDWSVTCKVRQNNGGQYDLPMNLLHHVRGVSKDGVTGTSLVEDVREAIALEIAAERFGASFFGNGAMPMFIFRFMQGMKGFKTDDDAKKFISDFQRAFTGLGRFKAMSLPAGMEIDDKTGQIENNKAQFIETRKYQRTVIAGAWGVPPHLVGDLERGTFNNVEQQSLDFIMNVVYPYIKMFESAMVVDFLTEEEIEAGLTIRFNLEAALRADFKARQDGLQLQRQNGVINANEWRALEDMNPIDGPEGETYWVASGVVVAGQEPADPGATPPTEEPEEPEESEDEKRFIKSFRERMAERDKDLEDVRQDVKRARAALRIVR